MIVLTAISATITLIAIGPLPAVNRLDLVCFEFLAWWWIAYFCLSHRIIKNTDLADTPRSYKLFTLRSYLDQISSHRASIWSGEEKTEEDQRFDESLIRQKATSSRDVLGIMIAVVVLLLTLVLVDEARNHPLSHYQMLIRGVLFALAVIIVILWALSLDIFDSILNSFNVDIREALHLRRYYYREMGPLNIPGLRQIAFSGSVSYGYVGHALMPIFTLMVFSWFEPILAGYGTALFLFFAYPYFFGYWAIDGSSDLARGKQIASGPRWQVTLDGDRSVRVQEEVSEASAVQDEQASATVTVKTSDDAEVVTTVRLERQRALEATDAEDELNEAPIELNGSRRQVVVYRDEQAAHSGQKAITPPLPWSLVLGLLFLVPTIVISVSH